MQVNKTFQLYNQFSNLQLFLTKNGTFNVLFLGAKNQVFIANLRKPQNQLLRLEQKKKSTYIPPYYTQGGKSAARAHQQCRQAVLSPAKKLHKNVQLRGRRIRTTA